MHNVTSHLQLADDSNPLHIPETRVERHELANGLTILVQSDYSAPVVSLQYWCETGSIHESPRLGSGISHLMEHLMFKGTPTRGNSEMAQGIQSLGGHLNAYTSLDRTVYYVDLPSDNWKPALEILSDAIFHSTVPVEEFEKEKDVIRREFAMGQDSPDRELSKLVFHTVFTQHPYRYPVIGYLDLFNQITRDDVLDYYHTRYSPQNLTLLVCGALDAAEFFAEAEKIAGKIQRRPITSIDFTTEPAQMAPRYVNQSFPTELNRLTLCHPIPGLHHNDIPALDVLAILMGSGRSSRLNQVCVEKTGLAEEVESFAFAPPLAGIWGIDARCSAKKHAKLVDTLREEILRITKEPPTALEIERAKRQTLLHQLHGMKTMSGKAAAIGRGWIAGRDPLLGQHYLSRIQEVKAEEIWRVARSYLLPSTENLVELVANDSTKKTSKSVKKKAVEQKLDLFRITETLRGLHYTSTQLPLVSMRAVLNGGLLAEPPQHSGINYLTTQMLLKGTKRRSAEALATDIEQLGGHVSVDAGNNSSTLGLELLSGDWKAGLDILLEILTEPAFSADELATEKRKQLSSLQAEKDHPMALARNEMRAAFFSGHPYSQPPLGNEKSVAAIEINDIRRHAESQLLNGDAIIALAGPTPRKDWEKIVAAEIGSLAKKRRLIPAITPPAPPSKPQFIKHHCPKEQAVLQIGFPTPPLMHEDHVGLAILDEALSDLGSRLFIKIREDLGLAYFVGTSQFLGLAAGYFVFYCGTDPKKQQQVQEKLHEEVIKLAESGITTAEMERARAKILSQYKIESQNPGLVLQHAALDELFGMGYDFEARRLRLFTEISLAQTNQIARKYFSNPNHVTVVVSPE